VRHAHYSLVLTLLTLAALVVPAAIQVDRCAAQSMGDASPVSASHAATGKALELAVKHARTHARCLGVVLSSRIAHSDDVAVVRRYVRRTWLRMRHPCWQGLGARAWTALAQHAGWPASTVPILVRVITRESNGQPSAVLGCYRGLLQIGAYNAPSCDLFNPYTNLRVGAQMYARLGWRPWAATAW
jgi:hypothetical protein